MKTLDARFEVNFPSFALNVELQVPAEGVTAVFGPSGCGKTTFLRCLAGLERGRGHLKFGEQLWQDDRQSIFMPLSLRPIGYVFQEPRLFPHFDVRGNLLFGLKRTPPQARRISWDQVVKVLDLRGLLGRRPAQLSGGESQRVAIGRALLTSPELLLMDEPLSSLDGERKREILSFIHQLNVEFHIPILYVTHSLQEVIQLASTLVLLKNGRVSGVGPLEKVFSSLDSREFLEDQHIGAIMDSVIEAHHSEFKLTKLSFGGRYLYVPQQKKNVGDRVRVQIFSRDVSIVTSIQPFQSSVLNVLEARVVDIGPLNSDHPFVDVKLDIGCPLFATITRKSLATLKLHPGQRVYAQIKTVALSQDVVE